jgi:RimJ/RimL family protein N-acetyltransferase
MRLLIAEGCADPSLRELDLGIGNESYKKDFATTVRRTYRAELSCSLLRHIRIAAWNLVKAGAARYPQTAVRLKQARKLTGKIMSRLARRLHSEGLSATLAYTAKRATHLVVSPEESLFFEASVTDNTETSNTCLEPLTWENLADAAIADADDADTLQYLLGSMPMFKDRKTPGFVLRDPKRQAVHFLFVADADGFHVGEIDYTIRGVDPQDMLIFNCWTPARYRGRGYYALAIRRAAAELLENQRRVWIACQATNSPSIRGILKAGFAYRYSLVRHRRLGRSTVSRRDRTGALAQFSH